MKQRVLQLNLHRRWFDLIASGEKTEEYRGVVLHWTKRIENREYDVIEFRNGYRRDAPMMRVQYLGWRFAEWEGVPVYALQLGRILEVRR